MAEIQENQPLNPLPRTDLSLLSVQDDFELSKERALQLLRRVISDEEWKFFEKKGILKVSGRRGIFIIYPSNQTEIVNRKTGQCVARTCLRLSILAPVFDRMAAEYLLLKNDEEFYWKTANIFKCYDKELTPRGFFLLYLCAGLYLYLLFNVIYYALCQNCL